MDFYEDSEIFQGSTRLPSLLNVGSFTEKPDALFLFPGDGAQFFLGEITQI